MAPTGPIHGFQASFGEPKLDLMIFDNLIKKSKKNHLKVASSFQFLERERLQFSLGLTDSLLLENCYKRLLVSQM